MGRDMVGAPPTTVRVTMPSARQREAGKPSGVALQLCLNRQPVPRPSHLYSMPIPQRFPGVHSRGCKTVTPFYGRQCLTKRITRPARQFPIPQRRRPTAQKPHEPRVTTATSPRYGAREAGPHVRGVSESKYNTLAALSTIH